MLNSPRDWDTGYRQNLRLAFIHLNFLIRLLTRPSGRGIKIGTLIWALAKYYQVVAKPSIPDKVRRPGGTAYISH